MRPEPPRGLRGIAIRIVRESAPGAVLNDMADLFAEHLGIELRDSLGSSWQELEESWAARHVFTHCDGIVDDKYLIAVPHSRLRVGQRLQVSEQLTRNTLLNAERLVRALVADDGLD